MRLSRAVLAAPRKYRVVIVDDHTVVRQGVLAALASERDIEPCGEAASALEAISLLRTKAPDVIVLDLILPDTNGVEVIRALREVSSTVKIVVLSMHDEPEVAREALRAGANGYVVKTDALSELAVSIRHVVAGTPYLSSSFSNEMLAQFLGQKPTPPQSPKSLLTPQELEIVKRLANGKRNREIAADMGLSIRTVETHRHRVMRKLHFSSLSDIIRFALRNQLVRP